MMRNKTDVITFICFLLIIAAMLTIGFYWNISKVNECTSDPLKYAVEKIRADRDADTVSGNIRVITKGIPTSWDFGDEYNLFRE